MAKTESPRTIAAVPMPADLPPAEPPESLDKVRDILFGGQMRAVGTADFATLTVGVDAVRGLSGS